ncbi:MAG: NYN domain-containing protein [Acidimicrobiia bacterium]
MPSQHFVVDGSNIATEGRTTPSLAQLQEAMRAFREDYPEGSLTVVVDASFAHRIDEAERVAFERAEARGELVSPPAGAIGRGDGFLLQIADRTHATVLSNDSFQEFHGEYPWLFDVSRLVGGKPVPGVGWIFSLRTPVRGARSRQATRVKARPLKDAALEAKPPARPSKMVTAAIAAATAEALSPAKRRPRRRKGPSPEAVNEPAPFLQFLIDHRLGSEVEGTVEEFASHGAFVAADGVRAYLPLAGMGDPPPTRARDVLEKGERRAFIVQAVDAPRRAIEVGLPGFAHPAGAPSDEMVEEVTRHRTKRRDVPRKTKVAAKPEKEAKRAIADKKPAKKPAPAKKVPPLKRKTVAKKTVKKTVKKEASGKRASTKQDPTKKPAALKKPAPTKRTAKKGATARKRTTGRTTGKS